MALSENRTTNQKILTASNDALEECSICYEPFTNKAFASDCLHNFCYQCIYTWVQLRATCPLCLHPITSIIKNVRSIDDYDIEQVTPPQIDVFGNYMADIDTPHDGFGYDSDIDDESMSVVSDPELYEYEFSDDNENLPSASHASHSSQESVSQINLFNAFLDEEFGTDEGEEDNEVSEGVFTENLPSSSEDEKDDDDNGDNDENDENEENHSGNEEFFEDYEDEDYENDDNNNEDEYEDDDNNEEYANFSDTCDEDDDFDRLSVPRHSFSSECESEDRSQEQGYVLSKFSDFEDSDSDPEYSSSPYTASYAYSCDYF